MERRSFTSELRTSNNGKTISGYAARYDVAATLPGFQERIAKGAFDSILATNPDCVCLFNHDANHVLGRTTSGTLTLRADNKGLFYTCNLPDTQVARDLHQSIQRQDISGCSFAFTLGEDDQEWANTGGVAVRTIRSFSSLQDVSPVTYPCYDGTSVAARGLVLGAEVRSRVEQILKPTMNKRWQRLCESYGVNKGGINEGRSFEDVIFESDRRRRRMLAEMNEQF
jgi:HK97 family phage prohead protease